MSVQARLTCGPGVPGVTVDVCSMLSLPLGTLGLGLAGQMHTRTLHWMKTQLCELAPQAFEQACCFFTTLLSC